MIELENISHTYSNASANRLRVLENVSLKLMPGESCALMGPSGSGKSTLIYIMAMLLKPTSGKYVFDGTDVRLLKDSRRAAIRLNKIGCVIQDYALLSDRSALDNAITPLLIKGGLSKSEIRERGMAVLKNVGLENEATRIVGKLSGGQRQRVAIARALITQPELILADEPTAQLDAKNARKITDLLLNITYDKAALVFATHDADLAREFHHIINMR